MSFLHATLRLDLICIPTKNYQVISNSMEVMTCTRHQGRYVNYGESESSLEHDMPTGPYLCLYQILSKYFKPHTQGFSLEIHSGEVSKKNYREVVSLVCDTPTVDSNASTKYYQNMSKGIKVIERTRFWLQGDNYIMKKKVRVVSLACDTPTGPPSLPNIFISSQTVWELWPAQDFGFRGDNYISKKVRVVSLAWDMPIGPPLHFYQTLSKYV